MSPRSIILVGCPDSGKTNFLARLWESLRTSKGQLKCPRPPDNIKYLEEVLAHLLKGKFAPRTDKNSDEFRADVVIPVTLAEVPNPEIDIVVPDVSGELWASAVERLEIAQEWMDELKRSSGALLFLRVLSDQNVVPLNWVTARKVLRCEIELPADAAKIPTQVVLCELLRFLETCLIKNADGSKPRVAVIIAAWDRLDAERSAAGPTAFLRSEFPLFAGRIVDTTLLDVRTFGISVVGGDLNVDEAFRAEYLRGTMSAAGYLVVEQGGGAAKIDDLTLPVAWIISGKQP